MGPPKPPLRHPEPTPRATKGPLEPPQDLLSFLETLLTPTLTTEALQDEVELAPCLEGVDEVNDEGVLDSLQDVPLSSGVSRVLGVAGDLGLGGGAWEAVSFGGGGLQGARGWVAVTFFRTFMAKIFPVLVPWTLRTWKT